MYVAMTRARRRLYLSFAQSRMLHGQTRYNIASRFLNEIPENCLKWLQSTPKIDQKPFYPGASKQTMTAIQRTATYNQQKFSSNPWRIGQNVLHAKFGGGVIINCEGSGSEARVQVNFDHAGIKWLLLEYAKLTAV
jgi:DNA helicase-2/ATP-dependent DNA helicase PcrA